MTNLLRALALAFVLIGTSSTVRAQAGHDEPAAGHAEPDTHAQPADDHSTAAHGDDAHGGEHVMGPVPAPKEGVIVGIMTLIVFTAVLGVLYLKVWPQLTKGLDDRANKIREEIEAAELARKQAKDALDEYERNLAEARAEAQQMLDKTREDQQRLAAELRAKADAELGELRKKAMTEIEGAKRAALGEIYAEAAALAATAAGKILQREITPDDQQRLIDESLAELQSRN